MDTENDKLERIRTLLAQAEKADIRAEADIYNRTAAELTVRDGVDAAVLADAEPGREVIGTRTIATTGTYSREKAALVALVAFNRNCRPIKHPGADGAGPTARVTTVGFESDLERAELTSTSLLRQAARLVVQQHPLVSSGESVAAVRRSRLVGFTADVHRRLADAVRQAAADHDSRTGTGQPFTEFVLADRCTLVAHAAADRFPGRHPGRRRHRTDGDHHPDAGHRADLGRTRHGPARPELGPGHT